MTVIAKVISWVAYTLAGLWLAAMVVGLFGKLHLFMQNDGFLVGLQTWYRWFDPTDPVHVLIHVVEALPAVALLALARWARDVSARGAVSVA